MRIPKNMEPNTKNIKSKNNTNRKHKARYLHVDIYLLPYQALDKIISTFYNEVVNKQMHY